MRNFHSPSSASLMSFVETSLQTSYPDELSEAVAKMTASILQEQLAPIVETLREHARLLDLHSALLNHSTAVNRYNVGKIHEIRDLQNNVNFKLKHHSQTPSASTSTEPLESALSRSRLPAADGPTQADEPTHSTAASSSPVEASPGWLGRLFRLAPTERADSPTTTPRQQLGGGFSVVPGPSRRLQRERPFSVAPDPMWNSSREIQPNGSPSTQTPPPPYIPPPTYAEAVPPGQIGSVVQVDHSEPSVEIIEDDEPSTLQSSTLDVHDVSVSVGHIPHAPVPEEVANNTPSYSFGPSWTFASSGLPKIPTASEDEAADNVESDHENPNVGSWLSGKALGKKRMREEDCPSDDNDDLETLEILFGEGSGSGNSTSSDRDGQPDRKRLKTDADTDTTIDPDRLEVDEPASMVAPMCPCPSIELLSGPPVKKLKEIEKLYRSGRLLL